MRCKVGDLALVIKQVPYIHTDGVREIDRIEVPRLLTVVEIVAPGKLLYCWLVKDPIRITHRWRCRCCIDFSIHEIADCMLLPIRVPPEDDEQSVPGTIRIESI